VARFWCLWGEGSSHPRKRSFQPFGGGTVEEGIDDGPVVVFSSVVVAGVSVILALSAMCAKTTDAPLLNLCKYPIRDKYPMGNPLVRSWSGAPPVTLKIDFL
jgi:hypothetical protein